MTKLYMRIYKNGLKCNSNTLLTDEVISNWLFEKDCPSIIKDNLTKQGDGFWSLLYQGHRLVVTIDNNDKLHYTISEAPRKSSEELNQWKGMGYPSFIEDMLEAYQPLNKGELEESICATKKSFREKVYKAQHKKLIESIEKSIISEIKEIYKNYVSDISSTKGEPLIEVSFTISGAGTSFEEVEGDMDNIANAYGMIVSDFSSFCEEGQDIDCDEYLRTGQPVEFCVSFEYLEN